MNHHETLLLIAAVPVAEVIAWKWLPKFRGAMMLLVPITWGAGKFAWWIISL